MSVLTSEQQRWTIIYPVYLNARKTLQEGRRIPKAKAADNPTAQEICDICKHLGFECVVEPDKAYPRDWMMKGRVRVKIKQDEKPLKPELPNRRQLMIRVAELIPKLQTRQGGKGSAVSSGGSSSSPSGGASGQPASGAASSKSGGGRRNRRK